MIRPFYEDAAVTLYLGDCREVLPTLDVVDQVITDPPYSEHTHAKQWIGAALTDDGKARVSTAHKELGFESLTTELRLFAATQFQRLARRWVLVFSDLEGAHLWQAALAGNRNAFLPRGEVPTSPLDYVRTCVWDKVDSAPQFTGDRPAASAEAIVVAHPRGKKAWNGGGQRNVFRHAVNGERGDKPHPTTKPETLMRELVTLFTDPGDLILDPFGGSGTTAVAAKRLGRRCILIEREEKYCEVAANRLRQSALDLWEPGKAGDAVDPVNRGTTDRPRATDLFPEDQSA